MVFPPAVLGVDFGTSHTVAALRMPSGRTEPLLFDASPLLPSAVFAQPDGELLVGHDALRGSRLDPGRLEPNPKRRIDDGTLLLGDVETVVEDAVRAVLARVAQTGQRALGAVPRPAVLTHPAGWGAQRRRVLAEAAAGAGLGAVRLVAEPIAAALYFTEVLGHRVEPGGTVVVYDLGGGTFDISAVRRVADGGWEVLATAGLDDVGGVDIDAAIVDWITAHTGAEIAGPGPELAERRRWQLMRQEAREAKEQLSRVATAPIVLPGRDRHLHLTRDEFEQLARPLLERTVTLTTSTLFASGVAADRLAGLFLVGGSSRIPLVATMLHRALGVAPTVIEQPELVVAHGSLCARPTEGARPIEGAPPAEGNPPTETRAATDARPAPADARPVPTEANAERPASERPTTGAPTTPSRLPVAAVAVLFGAVAGAAMTAYPLVTRDDWPLPYWTERYAWQLVPLAGVLAGLWSRRRGAALAAQAVSGVVAGFVGLAVERAGRTIFHLPWGTPIELFYWGQNPDRWFVALVGGCLAVGLALEAAFAGIARFGGRGTASVAAVAAAGLLANVLLVGIFNWRYHPEFSRMTIDALFAYPFVFLLAWAVVGRGRRSSR